MKIVSFSILSMFFSNGHSEASVSLYYVDLFEHNSSMCMSDQEFTWRGRVGTDMEIKLLPVTCITKHIHCSCSIVTAQVHSAMHISIPTCLLCFLYNPYNYVPFNSFRSIEQGLELKTFPSAT